ncbi:hypothetical protein QFC24_006720 [Naganishia onofrii]|uniref:Uncharacterized protein n=1 Tax=Naganishia onofrii TaxID=1851511 RepID=A0ACC2WYF8_9TREE|nr:hypothetical protein QFC24_006720 [Naganishia onofrii]
MSSIKDATQVVRALGGIVVRYDELKEEHLHYHDHNHNNHNNNDNDNNEDDDHHHNSTSTASPPNPSNPPNSSNPRPPPPLLVLVNGSDLTPFRRASHTVRWVVNSLLFVTTSTTTATTSNNSTTTNSTTTNSTIRTDSNANSNSSSNAAATATATAAARNRNRNSAANSRSGLNPLCSVSGTHATKILQNAANPVKMEQAEDQQEQESQESDTENVLPRTYVSVDHPSPSLSLFVLSEEDHTQHVHAQQVAHEAHEDSEKGASGKVRQWKWKAALKNADAQGAEVPVPSRTSNTNTMLRKRKRHDLTEHEHEHEHHRQKQSTSTNHGLTSLSSEAALAPAPNHRGTIAVPAGVAATTTTTSSDADDDTDIVSGPPQQQPYVQVQGGCEKLGLDEVSGVSLFRSGYVRLRERESERVGERELGVWAVSVISVRCLAFLTVRHVGVLLDGGHSFRRCALQMSRGSGIRSLMCMDTGYIETPSCRKPAQRTTARNREKNVTVYDACPE